MANYTNIKRYKLRTLYSSFALQKTQRAFIINPIILQTIILNDFDLNITVKKIWKFNIQFWKVFMQILLNLSYSFN